MVRLPYLTVPGTGPSTWLTQPGHIRAKQKSTSTGIDAYNLGTGTGHSVLEVINAFELSSGQKVKWKIASRRPGDIAECYADAGKAKLELGWEAKRGLAEMCLDAWRFVQGQ